MLSFTRVSCFAGLLFTAGIKLGQAEFSAEIVDLPETRRSDLARLYFAHDKRRIEMQPASIEETVVTPLTQSADLKKRTEIHIQGRENTIILNIVTNTSTVLRPQSKTYLQAPLGRLKPIELYGLYAFITTEGP